MSMRPARTFPVAALAGACTAVLLAGGCGSQGTIPSSRSGVIQQHLDDVRSAVDAGDCSLAAQRADRVRSEISNLQVPQRLRANLLEGADKLSTAAATDCQDAQTTTAPATTETTPPPTTTTETTTTPTTTTPTTTAPETTPTETTPTPTTTTPSTGGATPGDNGGNGDNGGTSTGASGGAWGSGG
jgi:hypothetical protein